MNQKVFGTVKQIKAVEVSELNLSPEEKRWMWKTWNKAYFKR